jgi:hypothetical protein
MPISRRGGSIPYNRASISTSVRASRKRCMVLKVPTGTLSECLSVSVVWRDVSRPLVVWRVQNIRVQRQLTSDSGDLQRCQESDCRSTKADERNKCANWLNVGFLADSLHVSYFVRFGQWRYVPSSLRSICSFSSPFLLRTASFGPYPKESRSLTISFLALAGMRRK